MPVKKAVPRKNADVLTDKQEADYRVKRESFIEWLEIWGKNPQKVEGYSEYTIKDTADRTARFDRWVWNQEEEYTEPTQIHADRYVAHLAKSDLSNSHKGNERDAITRFFNWKHHKFGEDKWESPIPFSSGGTHNPQDYLTKEERKKIREAALNYGSIPDYNSVTPSQRKKLKRHVAQILRIPLEEITPDHWKQVNRWKYTSMTWTSLDAGLRPVEIRRAKVGWVDVGNQVLRIPKQESSKNEDNWTVSITSRTAEGLKNWLDERASHELYEHTDALWLTREGNPYQSKDLQNLLHNLCDNAGIDYTYRKMSWYSIRHSVGTYMSHERGLAAAQAQLRHRSVQTTMKYDQAPVEDRREALDRMG